MPKLKILESRVSLDAQGNVQRSPSTQVVELDLAGDTHDQRRDNAKRMVKQVTGLDASVSATTDGNFVATVTRGMEEIQAQTARLRRGA